MFFGKEIIMARIIDGERRLIRLSVDDVLAIVREYQNAVKHSCCYEHTRELIKNSNFYLPEEI